MKSKNPYWNTMWSERDSEFYWSGIKHGFVAGLIEAAIAIGFTWMIVTDIKKIKKELEEA